MESLIVEGAGLTVESIRLSYQAMGVVGLDRATGSVSRRRRTSVTLVIIAVVKA